MTADAKPAEPVRMFPAARHVPIDIGILQMTAAPDHARQARRTYSWRPRHAIHADEAPLMGETIRNSRQA